MRKAILTSIAVCAAIVFGGDVRAQQAAAPASPPPALEYGPGLNLEIATKAVNAAAAEAKKNGWFMAIAVVTNGGHLVHFSRMDGTAFASIKIAQHKAIAAATFRRATKTFEDRVAQGAVALLTLDGIIASEGGIPLVVGGKMIGAIGCSGGTGAQDGQACTAGADAVK